MVDCKTNAYTHGTLFVCFMYFMIFEWIRESARVINMCSFLPPFFLFVSYNAVGKEFYFVIPESRN
jgi:hypothetical protein